MKYLLIPFFSLFTIVIFGQKKIDLDKTRVEVAHIFLPKYVVPDIDKRTYKRDLKINFKFDDFFNKEPVKGIELYGFTLTNDIPTVKIEASIDDVSFITVSKVERVEEKKDNAGKVISKKYYYKAVGRYKAMGNYSIWGPSVASQGASEQIDAGSLNTELTRETGEFDNYSKAYEQFNNLRNKFLDEVKSEYVRSATETVKNIASKHFGLTKRTYSEVFWLLDTKEHPEYAKHQELKGKIKLAVETMAGPFDQIAEFRKEIEPILAYFEECKKKYTEDSKKDKKMRYASFYNKMQLYYIAEMPDEAIKEAEALILNEYDESDGKNMIRLAKLLKEELNNCTLKTRHFKI